MAERKAERPFDRAFFERSYLGVHTGTSAVIWLNSISTVRGVGNREKVAENSPPPAPVEG